MTRFAASKVRRATSNSVLPEPRARSSIACRYRSLVEKSSAAKWLSARNNSSTRLTLSTNFGQSTDEISRRLVMTLRTLTLTAPCR